MKLDDAICYAAMLSHDTRFDGRFFVGVLSTGVYCRPVCRVKTPKQENCTFHLSAAAAEAQGFRPCLRCRPELAPGNAMIDAQSRLAQAAAGLIEDGLLQDLTLAEMAARLGVTSRHLRRVFVTEFGVSPVAYMQTQRLLLAKRLLTDTRLSVAEVAFAAGFGSVRRLNTTFIERYRMQPTALRKPRAASTLPTTLEFQLAYHPPYAWSAMLAFLAGRAIEGVEQVEADRYHRAVRISHGGKDHLGWLTVQQVVDRDALQVTLAAELAEVVPLVLGRVRRLFDLGAHPDDIARRLGGLAESQPGLRVPGAFDGFEMSVRAILGQQITVKAARTLAGRIVQRFGQAVTSPFPDIQRSFPEPATLAYCSPEQLAELGIIRSRVRAIQALAQALIEQRLVLAPGADVEPQLAVLRALPGIGEWTTQYLAMRALSWPDAFPHTDYGVRKALNETDDRKVLALAEAWRPWRAYAVMHLWRQL
ncbi:AraC family transcriptional regulator of adaptative response / DNA-3-methyladenine glycosylase II [Chitinivorax tropicus]|uniref:DNA-3-methyladenine glycosylase II n=1 Tax=Chitinivorax tropicus TaxID=714531 RepID=A0A840MF91_9PROT|nr:DNA-3-methyladenine glycosylase 2 [Chitinivorax tropicus]MBB5017934.1 AraC family transcriptional regulator of adaptative response / DNA-3-methyladenine glycosylase II [Chitinivorax tropicus]